MLKPSMKNFKHDLTSMGDECIVFWLEHCLALPFLGIGMRLTFSSTVATAESSRFADILNATP